MLVSLADTFRRNPRLNACFSVLENKLATSAQINKIYARLERSRSLFSFVFMKTCKRILNENLINFIEQSCYNEHER